MAISVINGVRQAYSRMRDRLHEMNDEDLDDLWRDLEEDDPTGEYSGELQLDIDAEVAVRYARARGLIR